MQSFVFNTLVRIVFSEVKEKSIKKKSETPLKVVKLNVPKLARRFYRNEMFRFKTFFWFTPSMAVDKDVLIDKVTRF